MIIQQLSCQCYFAVIARNEIIYKSIRLLCKPPMTSSHNLLDNLSRRDYRLVEKNDATKFRIPLGMRPVCGCIPTACKACKTAIFLPNEPFLTKCCYCHHFVRLKTLFYRLLPINNFVNTSFSACLNKAVFLRNLAMAGGKTCHFFVQRLLFLFLIMFLFCFRAVSQTIQSDDKWMEYIEELAESLEEDDERIETLYADLSFLAAHPFDLNTVNEEMLSRLPFLSDLQIEEIIGYRQRNGNMLTIYELKNVTALDWPTIELMLPFVYVGDRASAQRIISPDNLLRFGSNEFVVRYGRTLQEKQGYRPQPDSILQLYPNRQYLGEPFYHAIRYSYTFDERIQAGLVAEKDAGEPFWNSHHKGYDYYSAHVMLRYMGALKSLAIGDYKASFGQGLVLSHDFTPSRNAFLSQIERRNNGFRRHYSTGEVDFFRGVASTLQLKNVELSLFYSYRQLDATADSLHITSFKTDGMHRTVNDWEKRRNVPTHTYGGNIRYVTPQLVVGLTAIGYQFGNLEVDPTPSPYNLFYFRGNRNTNVSVDYQFKHRQIKFFGETAMSANGGWATLNTLQWTPTSYAGGLILYRSYARDYQSFYGNAFSQGSMVQNEQGLYLGIQLTPVANWKISGYADFFRFPWLKYGIDAPSTGVEYMMQADYSQWDKFSMYLRYRYRQKESNRTSANEPEATVLPEMQHRIRYQLLCKPSVVLSLKTALDFTLFDEQETATLPMSPNEKTPTDRKSRGWMISQGIGWKPSSIPLQADLYLAWFNTDDYSSRISSYEKNLLYVYGTSSFYDKGTHVSTVLRYMPTKQLALSTKIGWTHYTARETIGSALETIEGNNRTQVDLMIHWKF